MKSYTFVIDLIDKRNWYLMQSLIEDGYKTLKLENIKLAKKSDENHIYVFAPSTVIDNLILEKIYDNSIVFCLKVSGEIKDKLERKGCTIIRLFKDEKLAMQNAYLTCEGTLAIIIFNTKSSLKKSNILVLGYGRLGKVITHILKENHAKVTVATKPEMEQAIALVIADEVYDLNEINKYLPYFDVVINTIPVPIVNKDKLELLNKDCLIIDLASKPGGVNQKCAKELGLNLRHELGVPGKISPESAALFIKESILNTIDLKQKGNYE